MNLGAIIPFQIAVDSTFVMVNNMFVKSRSMYNTSSSSSFDKLYYLSVECITISPILTLRSPIL